MKKVLSGNEAIARGAYEYGVHLAAAYPGTPSTEILENLSKYPEIYSEWAPNEKVALEVAIGASFAGARSLTAMKHVGLNVAADPLFTMSYLGAYGGMVIISADDPSMHSSQNEQDNRHFARAAKIPCFEPADSQECKDFVGAALAVSEQFDTPVLLRTTTRINHSSSIVELGERQAVSPKGYVKNLPKNVAIPFFGRAQRARVEERQTKLAAFGNTCPWNRVERGSSALGIVTSGVSYQYVKEVFPDASVLKLGLTYPLPEGLIREFASSVKKLFVVEELDPMLETEIRALGIECEGKSKLPITFEFNPNVIANGFGVKRYPAPKSLPEGVSVPRRPPVLCAGCPHRGTFFALKRTKAIITGDIGCYTLGMSKPLETIETTVCMGASIGTAHGIEKVVPEQATGKIIAVLGDSTFIHSGITGLINAVYNRSNITVLILDNGITAMTGHQDNPATGKTLSGQDTHHLNIEGLCQACGVEHVRIVDPLDMEATYKVLKDEIAREGASVVISRSPCVLIDRRPRTAWVIDDAKCKKCGLCLRLGCPALICEDDHYRIDPALCADCSMCGQVCKQGAISRPGAVQE